MALNLTWLYLIIAIIAEVLATTFLKVTDGFTKILPVLLAVIGYSVAFFFLSLALVKMPVGIAYALWSAVGIIMISVAGFFVFKQTLDFPAILGIIFIVTGVLIMNLFSQNIPH